MKKIFTLAVAAFILGVSLAQAAKDTDKKTSKGLVAPDKTVRTELKIADKFYAESYFYTAIEYYKDAVRQDSANRYANFWLAMSLLQARDYKNAEVFFRQFYDIKPGEKANTKKWAEEDRILFNKGEYYFGEVLHRNGKYDEAIEHLNKFSKSYVPKEDKDHPDNFKKLADLEIAGATWSKTAPKAKVKIFNAGAGVNKSYTEASPFGVGENDLYYSTLRNDTKDSLIFINNNKDKKKSYYQIYHSVKEGNDWGVGRVIDNKDVNSDGYTVGNGTFNKTATRFYFTKCLEVDDNRSLCNLFVADFNNGTFSNVKALPETVNSKEKYTATQPSVRIAGDGSETVYFSTDRPGGAGGMDIWYTTRLENGEFKTAQPIKGGINTAGDELTPYYDDSTSTLYFTSNGLPGLGGFDVFKATDNADLSWNEPVNLGSPINTGADDLYYSKSTDQTNGFLVSNREGSVPLNDIKTASDDVFYWTNFRYAVQGLAFKEGEGGTENLKDATFKLYRKLPDGTKVLVSSQAPDGTTTSANGAVQPASANGAGPNRKAGTYFFKLEPETDYVVEVDRDGFQPKFENVSTVGLPGEDTIKNNIVVRKAMFTVKGLVAEEGKGTPVKDANVELVEVGNGVERTVYYMKSDPMYFFDVEINKSYKIVTRKEGYFANTTVLSTVGINGTDTIRKDIALPKLEMNKAYTLQNVLYEFGKSTLTENSKSVLDNLYQILVENPSFVIELSAHTDAIGSDQGNMKLSQDRAESCVKYLISKGTAKDRLVAKGYGKTKPKVPNTTEDGKDDPAGRAINRRTEFQIIGEKKAQ